MKPESLKRYAPLLALVVIVLLGLVVFRPAAPSSSGGEGLEGLEVGAGFGDLLFLLLQTALVLGAICGLAWLSLRWLLPRLYGSSAAEGGGQIRVVETHRLDSRRGLYLVEVRGRAFLLAGSEQGIRLLAALDEPPPPAAATGRPDFETVLRESR